MLNQEEIITQVAKLNSRLQYQNQAYVIIVMDIYLKASGGF